MHKHLGHFVNVKMKWTWFAFPGAHNTWQTHSMCRDGVHVKQQLLWLWDIGNIKSWINTSLLFTQKHRAWDYVFLITLQLSVFNALSHITISVSFWLIVHPKIKLTEITKEHHTTLSFLYCRYNLLFMQLHFPDCTRVSVCYRWWRDNAGGRASCCPTGEGERCGRGTSSLLLSTG